MKTAYEVSYEERQAVKELSAVNEAMGYLLGYIDAAITISEDAESVKMLCEAYADVVKARGHLRMAEQKADEFMSSLLNCVDDPNW